MRRVVQEAHGVKIIEFIQAAGVRSPCHQDGRKARKHQ
jgi:hypothetical protein